MLRVGANHSGQGCGARNTRAAHRTRVAVVVLADSRPAVLITGASTGIGKTAALHLAKKVTARRKSASNCELQRQRLQLALLYHAELASVCGRAERD